MYNLAIHSTRGSEGEGRYLPKESYPIPPPLNVASSIYLPILVRHSAAAVEGLADWGAVIGEAR